MNASIPGRAHQSGLTAVMDYERQFESCPDSLASRYDHGSANAAQPRVSAVCNLQEGHRGGGAAEAAHRER